MLQRGLASSPPVAAHFSTLKRRSITLQRGCRGPCFFPSPSPLSLVFGFKRTKLGGGGGGEPTDKEFGRSSMGE